MHYSHNPRAHQRQPIFGKYAEIRRYQAQILALEHIAIELGGGDVKTKLDLYTKELLRTTNSGGSRAAIEAVEQVLAQLTHSTDVPN